MLDHINLELKLPKEEYKQRLSQLQGRLYDLEQAVYQARVPVAIVSRGPTAADKVDRLPLFKEAPREAVVAGG